MYLKTSCATTCSTSNRLEAEPWGLSSAQVRVGYIKDTIENDMTRRLIDRCSTIHASTGSSLRVSRGLWTLDSGYMYLPHLNETVYISKSSSSPPPSPCRVRVAVLALMIPMTVWERWILQEPFSTETAVALAPSYSLLISHAV